MHNQRNPYFWGGSSYPTYEVQMNSPVFDGTDRVAEGIPDELKGKSAEDVAKHFQAREKNLLTNARAAIDRAKAEGKQPPPTSVTIERPTDDAQPLTKGEFRNATEAAQQTLIDAAALLASQQPDPTVKKYWERFLPQVKEIMKGISPAQQANAQYWLTAFYNLVGMKADELHKEENAAEATRQRIAAEPPSGGADSGAVPTALDPAVTSKVLPGLGISDKQYRDADKHIQEGKWPLTMSNTGR